MIRVSNLHARNTFSISSKLILRSLHNTVRPDDGQAEAANTPNTFEALGVDEYVVQGLKRAFPHITSPTHMQKEFIPAILSGKDILLQDRTGTGK